MSDAIHIKLPDGSTKEVPKGTTALDIAKSISPRLADAALAAKTNGDLIDLSRPLEKDTDLRLLTDKDPEALEALAVEVQAARKQQVLDIGILLDKHEFQGAAKGVRQLMFLEKFGEEVSNAVDAMED